MRLRAVSKKKNAMRVGEFVEIPARRDSGRVEKVADTGVVLVRLSDNQRALIASLDQFQPTAPRSWTLAA